MFTCYVPCGAVPAHSLRFGYDNQNGTFNWERVCGGPIRAIEGIGGFIISQGLQCGMIQVANGVYVFTLWRGVYVYSMITGFVYPHCFNGVAQCPGPHPYTFLCLQYSGVLQIVTINPVTMIGQATMDIESPEGCSIECVVSSRDGLFLAIVTQEKSIMPYIGRLADTMTWTSTWKPCQAKPGIHAAGFFRFVPPNKIEKYTINNDGTVVDMVKSFEYGGDLQYSDELEPIAFDDLTRNAVLHYPTLKRCYFLNKDSGTVTRVDGINPYVFEDGDRRTVVLNTMDGTVYHCDGTPKDNQFDVVDRQRMEPHLCLKLGKPNPYVTLWDYVWYVGDGLFVWSNEDGNTRAHIAIDRIDYAYDVVHDTKRSVFIVTQGGSNNKFDIAICYGKQWLDSMESTHFLLVNRPISGLTPPSNKFTFVGESGAYSVYYKNNHRPATVVGLEEASLGVLVRSLLGLVG